MDAQALRKRLGRASSEAARILLDSLLLYVLNHTKGPLKAMDGMHKASHSALLLEASRWPTRFQLLQAKFMGRGREPPLKRTREVGRLISKDRQGPGRSFVNATISQLLEKAQGNTSSPSQKPAAREKPRWGPGGKSTVKNILKKFLAVEEKEAKEQPPNPRPGAARGPLPKVAGRSTILTKLRERFEQSGCLHAEARVLPLHKEDRRSRALQRRTHRPEVRMLHTATMATSCTRTPPARFLACTAEPLPALSIATVVSGPRSWLSRCAKISHLDARRQAKSEASLSHSAGHTEPGRNETPGMELLSEGSRAQWEPSKSSMPQAMAPRASQVALSTPSAPQPEFTCVSPKDRALPSHPPSAALLSSASPRDAGPASGDRIVEPEAEGATDQIWGVEESTGEGPQVTMTMYSSEDESESVLPVFEKEFLFATQRWLPKLQQEPEACVPSAPPAVRVVQCTQPGMASPQITVQLPVVLEMPAPPVPQPSTLSHEACCPLVSQEEAVVDRVAPGPVAGDRRDAPALVRLSRTSQVPESTLSSKSGPQGFLRDTAGMDPTVPQTVLMLKPPSSPAGKGNPCSCLGPSRPTISKYGGETHLLPESNEAWMPSKARSCHHPPARESGPAGSSHPAPAPAPAPAHLPGLGPQEGRSLLAALQDHSQPKNCPFMDQRTHCGQEEHPRRPTELASPPGMTPGNTSHDSDKNESSFLGDQPETGILASRETSAVGTVREDTVPLAGTQKAPRVATPMAPQASAPAPRNKTAELTTLDEEGSRAPPACPCATVGEGLSQALAPSGPSMHRVGAAAGETLDPVQHQASTWVPPVVHPEDTAHPHQALTAPSLCAPNNSGASNPRASTGDKDIHATEQDTLHHGVTSQKLATRHSQESPRWPCTEPPSGTVRSSIHATGPAPTGEAWLTQPAPEHPAPDQQAEPRAVPQAKRSGPTPASLGPPEGHHGPVCSQQAGQSDDPQTMAMPLGGQGVREFELKPWAAKKLAGSEKPATREEPGPVGTQVEEHPPGPRIRQVGSLAWGNGTRTAESPVTQDRGQARGPAPQASVQPSSTAKGASTANREPSVPAPSTGTQGNPGIGRPSRGDESAVTCPPEPMHSPTLLTPDLRSHQDPQPQPETGAERDWPDFQRQRRLAHFTKYKAQSFSDQKAFDLSFRPMILRASDTFEAPK